MSRYFLYGTRFSEFEQMMMLVPNFTPKKKGVIITEDLIISNGQSVASYKILLRKCFGNLHHRYLNKRLSKLLQKFRGDLFLSDVHRHWFSSCCTPYANKRTCAVLYLISATDDLWARASPHISSGKINLVAIPLRGIDTDDYAIYQKARSIATGTKRITINEIADEQLIGNFAFRAIIHSELISKFGGEILSVK